jgi:hypothetical protein
MPNDNQPKTRAELEAANRELRTSLKKCEALVEECRERLVAAHTRVRNYDDAPPRRRETKA